MQLFYRLDDLGRSVVSLHSIVLGTTLIFFESYGNLTFWGDCWMLRVFFDLPSLPLKLLRRKVMGPSFILFARKQLVQRVESIQRCPSIITSLMGLCRLLITTYIASYILKLHFLALAKKSLHQLINVTGVSKTELPFFSLAISRRLWGCSTWYLYWLVNMSKYRDRH